MLKIGKKSVVRDKKSAPYMKLEKCDVINQQKKISSKAESEYQAGHIWKLVFHLLPEARTVFLMGPRILERRQTHRPVQLHGFKHLVDSTLNL